MSTKIAIGGGLSGLAAAYMLLESGPGVQEVRLSEASGRYGACARTESTSISFQLPSTQAALGPSLRDAANFFGKVFVSGLHHSDFKQFLPSKKCCGRNTEPCC